MAEIAAIALAARLNADNNLAGVAALVIDALREAELSIVSWSVPATARRKKVRYGELPAELKAERLQPEIDTATLELSDGSLGSLFHPFGESDWSITLDALVPKNSNAMVPLLLAAQRTVARSLLRDARATRVTISMQSSGAYCLPLVPHALTRTYLVSCTEAEITADYEDPKAFWQSGWSASEWIGERAMLERAMHTRDTVEYLREVIPHQWALVRAAKPGRCAYGIPAVLPEEREVYLSGEPALKEVGYEDGTAMVELSCALRPPRRVQGWEIFNIYGLLQSGSLPDGRAVKGLRVIFLYEAMARAERRPLLDVGAHVFYYDDDGQLHELQEG